MLAQPPIAANNAEEQSSSETDSQAYFDSLPSAVPPVRKRGRPPKIRTLMPATPTASATAKTNPAAAPTDARSSAMPAVDSTAATTAEHSAATTRAVHSAAATPAVHSAAETPAVRSATSRPATFSTTPLQRHPRRLSWMSRRFPRSNLRMDAVFRLAQRRPAANSFGPQ